jgi:hypothetical protein
MRVDITVTCTNEYQLPLKQTGPRRRNSVAGKLPRIATHRANIAEIEAAGFCF